VIPDVVFIPLIGLLGLLIGSFLNVVIYRVPRGESVVSPPSACPGCGTQIASYDNIPVLSWLILRGRCRTCRASISARYPFVEALTGLLFALMAWHFGATAQLPAWLYLTAVGVALAFIDLDHHRLPDALTLPSYPVALVLLGVAAAVDQRGEDYLRALIGMVILFAFYFALWFVYPAGMGFGDVKLSGVLGLYLAWISWGVLLVGAFLGFVVGTAVGIALIVGRGGGRKTKLPFGPSMLAGVLLAVIFGDAIVQWYLGATGI